MVQLPLHHQNGLLFLELSGQRWLFDTGSALSFGSGAPAALDGKPLAVLPILARPGKPLLTGPKFSQGLGMPCAGVLGMDVIGQFDWILNAAKRTCKAAGAAIPLSDRSLELRQEGPLLSAPTRIRDQERHLLLGSGQQLSYLEDASIETFAGGGKARDYSPSFIGGWFMADTYHVGIGFGAGHAAEILRCGRMPPALRKDAVPAGCDGLLGADFLASHFFAFARRRRVADQPRPRQEHG
ncbi:MAG: hypothetical protein ACKORI_08790, partial [Verrucomicrobiota bacterium]